VVALDAKAVGKAGVGALVQDYLVLAVVVEDAGGDVVRQGELRGGGQPAGVEVTPPEPVAAVVWVVPSGKRMPPPQFGFVLSTVSMRPRTTRVEALGVGGVPTGKGPTDMCPVLRRVKTGRPSVFLTMISGRRSPR
jgi:hypothetical protein